MKKGISLIVLVITIIVMIILAASVVITLSNTGIINRASEAVDLTNESQIQDLASLVWADAYMDNLRGQNLIDEVTTKLSEHGVTTGDWNIEVTDTGVSVTNKNSITVSELGSLITVANYGDKVDYSVTVDGIVYDDWQIYYHDDSSVYLILENVIPEISLNKGITVESLTENELGLYGVFMGDPYMLTDITLDVYGQEQVSYNSQSVAQLIKDYANFANKTDYGIYVEGAIGGPTIELLEAAWDAKGYTPTFQLGIALNGYQIDGGTIGANLTSDGLYILSDYRYWLASPGAGVDGSAVLAAGEDWVSYYSYDAFDVNHGVRPVVCLASKIPATVGSGEYDFCLVK
ncbi:MAG: type II secretion system protein [Clostridia bacterium]|nr:type II secretion system protein [Clostridia bacterium]